MSQPTWKFIDNLGDADPVKHGGYFIYEDETGVYAPEAEYLEEPCDDMDIEDPRARWTVYRFILDPCFYTNGILSDNEFHLDHATWWAKDVPSMAASVGESTDAFTAKFCSTNPIERAWAYREVAQYWGWNEFDHYPLTLTLAEVALRYDDLYFRSMPNIHTVFKDQLDHITYAIDGAKDNFPHPTSLDDLEKTIKVRLAQVHETLALAMRNTK